MEAALEAPAVEAPVANEAVVEEELELSSSTSITLSDNEASETLPTEQNDYSSYLYEGLALGGILASAAAILYYSATHRDIKSPIVGLAGNIIKSSINKYNPFANDMPKLTEIAESAVEEFAKQVQDNGAELGNDFMGKAQDVGVLIAAYLSTKTDEELDSEEFDILEEVSLAIGADFEDIGDDLMAYLNKVEAAIETGTYEVDEEIGSDIPEEICLEIGAMLAGLDRETGIEISAFEAVGADLAAQENTRSDSAIDIDPSSDSDGEDLDDCYSDSSDGFEIINLDCYGKDALADEQV